MVDSLFERVRTARLETARQLSSIVSARKPFRSPWVIRTLAVLAIVHVVGAAALAWFLVGIVRDLPGQDAIERAAQMAEATRLYDRHDRAVFAIYQERRIDVPLEGISPWLVKAILATEDQRFYEHDGLDYVRIAGAAWANIRARRTVQGGSTITQQLARQSFLTPAKTVRRKIAEAVLAARFERHYTKDDILRLYLNKVYFGDGFYGVEAASLGYFGVHAADLRLDEAALLAGLVKSPSSYAPTVNLERAISRRNVVLQAMRDAGAIDQETWARAREAKVVLQNLLDAGESDGLHFKEQVRRQLVERFGWERVYQGGLRVYTTLDPAMQGAAESAVKASLEAIDRRRARKRDSAPRAVATAGTTSAANPEAEGERLQAALVAMDAATGEVRALVGGRDFTSSSFDRAVQARRQPGSAFKPFVFAWALESGMTPATLIDRLDEPVATVEGAWTPDDDHSGAQAMTLRTALRTSSNKAAVRLLDTVGIGPTIDYARSVGIEGLPAVPSLALGSGEVTLLGLTAAYVPFATGGLAHDPVFIRRVEDSGGNVLFESAPKPRRVVSASTAFQMAQMLADVVNAGTGYRARAQGFTLPAAGKTGTTNDYHDAWFVGFTPSLVAGVWIGFDQPRTILPDGYAGDLAAPLWGAFMKEATRGHERRWVDRPRDIVAVDICRLSGLRPNSGCDDVEITADNGETSHRSMVYTEYFKRGTVPATVCQLHRGSFFDRVIGAIAGGEDTTAAGGSGALGIPGSRSPAALPGAGVAEDRQPRDGDARQAGEQPKKKRGFWARLFGIGGEDKDKDGNPGKDQKKKDEKKPKREDEQEKKPE